MAQVPLGWKKETLSNTYFRRTGAFDRIWTKFKGVVENKRVMIVIDRLEGFQSGDFACIENGKAIADLHRALANLRERTDRRKARGVEGTHTV